MTAVIHLIILCGLLHVVSRVYFNHLRYSILVCLWLTILCIASTGFHRNWQITYDCCLSLDHSTLVTRVIQFFLVWMPPSSSNCTSNPHSHFLLDISLPGILVLCDFAVSFVLPAWQCFHYFLSPLVQSSYIFFSLVALTQAPGHFSCIVHYWQYCYHFSSRVFICPHHTSLIWYNHSHSHQCCVDSIGFSSVRTSYKLAMIMYKFLHGIAQPCLVTTGCWSLISAVTSKWHLWYAVNPSKFSDVR